MRLSTILIFLIAISCKPDKPSVENTEVQNGPWEATHFYDREGNVIGFNYIQPIDQKDDELYPLVLFLHGAGERGDDNEAQLVHIAPIFASDSIRKAHPSFVVFPQCPTEQFWAPLQLTEGEWRINSGGPPDPSMSKVMALVDNMIKQYPIDTNRLYISGLSMGGFGTFDYLARQPDKWAAAVPICGGGDLNYANSYAHVPMKIFHGAMDQVVPVTLSREIHQALMDAEASDLEYIEFPEGGHGVWNDAYDHEGLLDWMFSQRKGTK